MLFGFYDNVFVAMRKCFEELGRAPDQPMSALVALSSVDEARPPGRYVPHRQNTAVLQQRLADGTWHNLVFDFPGNTDPPGDAGELPHGVGLHRMAVEFLRGWLKTRRSIRRRPRLPVPGRPGGSASRTSCCISSRTWTRHHTSCNTIANTWSWIRRLARYLVRLATGRHHRASQSDLVLKTMVELMREYLRLVWRLTASSFAHNWDAFKLWTARTSSARPSSGSSRTTSSTAGSTARRRELREWIVKHSTVPEGTFVTNGSC